MKKILFIISAIYCAAYVFFDFPDTVGMKILTSVMSLIFSISLLVYIFYTIDKIFKNSQ